MKRIEPDKFATRRTALYAALIACGLTAAGAAQAAPSISGFELLSGGTLDAISINNLDNTIDLSKTLSGVEPLVLRITVAHGTGSGGPFTLTESVRNMTGSDWAGYALDITGDDADGVVFNNFSAATMTGFTLDDAPTSGPVKLSFTGSQANGASADAAFTLSFRDPGAGQTYTVDLVQAASPVPLPMAGYLLGTALMGLGLVGRRRRAA
ncbi:MAG: VPLPA-CTERM sorting domain-containing protein [Gammaproteobacteria bacterium]